MIKLQLLCAGKSEVSYLIPRNASLNVLIKRVSLVFDYPFKMVQSTATLLYSSCWDYTKSTKCDI